MSLFFLTFFLIYAGVHGYFFTRARAALGFGIFPGLCLALLLVCLVIAPLLVRVAEKRGFDQLAHILAWSGYLWMGVLFLFFVASLLGEGYQLGVRLASFFTGRDLSGLLISARAMFAGPAIFAILAGIYSYGEALHIRTEQVTIRTPKLPAGSGRLRVVQVSDVHLGLIIREARLGRMLAAVREAKPDIFVATGDLVDGQINGLYGLAEMLGEIQPRFGKFAIPGNHEYYAGVSQALDFTRRAGFAVLRGEAVQAGPVVVVGVDDPAGKQFGRSSAISEPALLSSLPRDRFTILLKHRPALDRRSFGLFDLQLSGHVHKGQIFPFNLVTYLFYPVRTGLSSFPGGSLLYVSRGTGTWGAPLRFLAPPEVTIIDLLPAGTP